MTRKLLTLGFLMLAAHLLRSPIRAASPDEVKTAAERSIALLQKCGPEFFRKSGCVACHQQSVTSFALAEARSRGLRVDEPVAREQVHVTITTLEAFRDRLLQRADHPLNSGESTGYLLMGLAAEKYSPDETTDVQILEMASRQAPDGSWTAFGHRPPLEYSRVSSTALAIRTMQIYGPPGRKEAFSKRISRGRDWLLAFKPTSNTDECFRLLGLKWTDADPKLIDAQKAAILSHQREDGGWAPLDKLSSDAYATGLTLYALYHGGGLATADPAYERGVGYLLKTQLPDGSWHVKSRSFPFQTYFESGFPHGPDQWISAAATGFAAAAVIDSLPPK